MWLFKCKRSKNWYVGWRDAAGKQHQASTRTSDKNLARKRASRILAEAEDRAPAYPLAEGLRQLARHKARMQQSESTMDVFRCKSGHLLRLFGSKRDLCELTLEDTEAYLDRRRQEGAADRTIEMELGTLRAVLRRGADLGYYHGDVKGLWPAALKGAYDPRGRADRWLTPAQFRLLYTAAMPSRRDHMLVYAGTGARYGELYRLEARDLDHGGYRVRIRGTKTGQADRWVSPTADAWDVLARRAADHPRGPLFPDQWSRSRMCQDLQTVCRRAGLPFRRLSANDFRRTFASLCLNHGVREDVAVRWLGHGSTQMVRQVYAQLGAAESAEQALRLPILGPSNGPSREVSRSGQKRSVLTLKTRGKP